MVEHALYWRLGKRWSGGEGADAVLEVSRRSTFDLDTSGFQASARNILIVIDGTIAEAKSHRSHHPQPEVCAAMRRSSGCGDVG